MGTVTVATFNSREQAEPAKRKLDEANVPAEIDHESSLEWMWFMATAVVKVRLKVRTEDYERALQSLQAADAMEGTLRDAIRCPECGSHRIEYPQFTRKFFMPNLLGLLAAFGILQREFYCEDCQYTWPKAGRKPSRKRPHQAPYYFLEGIVQPEMKPKPEG